MERTSVSLGDWGLVAGVAGWNILQNRVPRRVYAPLNVVGSALTIAVARASGLDREALGVGRGAAGRGWRAAAPITSIVVIAVGAAAGTPNTRRWFRDERVERRGLREFTAEALFRIPVGTALFEELLFRGLLWGRWSMQRGEAQATAANSALFGLWHVLPTMSTIATYRSGALARTRVGGVALVVGSVVVTAGAAVGFSELRHRARSVAAPIIVHASMNVAAFVAAWLAAPAREVASV